MSAKHTKGPWLVDEVDGCIAIAADSDGEVLAYLAQSHQQTNPRSAEEIAANARLISAAPELLEALVECIEDSQSVVDTYVVNYGEKSRPARLAGMREIVSKARAAIAKATGEQA